MEYISPAAAGKYDLGAPGFKRAFEFLRSEGLLDLPEGWIDLGGGVRASVQRYVTSPAEELSFETHDRHFDVQYILSGRELLGVREREGLTPSAPWDEGEDITFYEEPSEWGGLLLTAGDAAILSPQDAHKPRCAAPEPSQVRKIVVKVPV